MNNLFDFTGKKFIVTGASSGIGRSTAIRLSQQGASVILISRNKEKLEETLTQMEGIGHMVLPADLGELEDMSDLFDEILSDGRKLDGIVHCAAIATILPLNQMKRHKMEECMNINFYALIELVRQYSKKKYHNPQGSVVAVSSIAVHYTKKCQTLYAATKGAVNVAVQALAHELVDKGIRINSIMPASTDTAMMREAGLLSLNEYSEEDFKDQILGLTPPDAIADAILFLLSGASRATTGRAFYADGGLLLS